MPLSHGMRDVNATFQEATSDEVFDGSATGHTLDADVQTDPIDLLTQSGYDGLAVVVDIRTTPTDADEVLDITIQHSDTEGSGYTTCATFKQITKTSGRNGDCKDTYVKRFYTTKRYVRLDLNVGGTTPNFGTPRIYLVRDGDDRNQ